MQPIRRALPPALHRDIAFYLVYVLSFAALLSHTPSATAADPKIEFKSGDRICFIGNATAERLQYFGYFETLLHHHLADQRLVIRNLGYAGDEVRFRPRSLGFGTPDQHLKRRKADVVLAFFGFNESFHGKEGLPVFETELHDFIKHTLAQEYNGKSAPRLVLISPIAHEDTGNKNSKEPAENNLRLELYTAAMARIAAEHDVPSIDLFHATKQLYASRTEPYTINGIHLSQSGSKRLAPVLVEALVGNASAWSDDLEPLRAEVNEKDFHNFHDFRAVNGYYIYGGRSRRDHSNPPFTDAYVLENERAKIREMASVVDKRIWKVAKGETVTSKANFSSTRELYKVPTNFQQPVAIKSSEDAIKEFTVAEGYEINLFASEEDWPELKNPVNFTFDTEGRLWVATMPSYPQYLPPNKPNDKLLVFEDTDGDGKADKMDVFADGLHLPTGFELGDGGAYVAQEPNVVFLKDDDGDGKADRKEIILHGFDSADSHHAIGAFIWGPGGGIYMHEGTFHHTQVETPWGPQRNAHGGIYRFDPTRQRLETFVSYNFANPWGHCFDDWGQNFVSDASGGANFFGTAFSTRPHQFTGQSDFGPFRHKYQESMEQFFPKRVRPTAGCEIVSSRHFPPNAQGNYLLNNCIGFQGVLQHRVTEKDSGFEGKEIEPLLVSSDRNFRPTDLQIGPDGALYLVDWFNPLVGHMQHSLRDPNRDQQHGRIWRLTYPFRPLVKRVSLKDQPIDKLLDLLTTPEARTRHQVRIKLREFPTNQVVAEIQPFLARVKDDDNFAHHSLEALWVCQHHNAVNEVSIALLQDVLASDDYHARAAATRVVGFWRDQLPGDLALQLLMKSANDEHPRVRLEAVRAASWFDNAGAATAALEVLKHPMDYYLDYTLRHTIRRLEEYWLPDVRLGRPFASANPQAAAYLISRTATTDLINLPRNQAVFAEMLTRKSMVPQYRREAIEGLATLRGVSYESQLIDTLSKLDRNGDDSTDSAIAAMATMFTDRPAEELSKQREAIAGLASKGNKATTRRIATAALVTADQSVRSAWQVARRSTRRWQEILQAVPLVADRTIRDEFYEPIKPLVNELPGDLDTKKYSKFAQFVRISLRGSDRVLCLAEVEVMANGVNIAGDGTTTQSSTAYGGTANRPIDGNRDPVYSHESTSHTKIEANPWWEIDLGSPQVIDSITLFNRNDNGNGLHSDFLDRFEITVFDANRQTIYSERFSEAPPISRTFPFQFDAGRELQKSAIRSLGHLPGHAAETFALVAPLLKDSEYRDASIETLSRLKKSELPAAGIPPVTDQLLAYIKSVPDHRRTQDATTRAIQLGKDLTSLLPKDKATAIRRRLAELAVDVIVVHPIPHRMQFDRPHIYVQAGKRVEIVFENTDIMPHNLLITTPGAREHVGILAEKMGAQGASASRGAMQFVPKSNKVLHSTKMLQPKQKQRLRFRAPKEIGDYPYVCTFPGHWRSMYGTMHVVKDISEIPLEVETNVDPHDVVAREFVRKWSVEDLFSSANELDSGRSHSNGKQLFQQMSCIQCHAMNKDGGLFGPDLSLVKQKMASREWTLPNLLESLVMPSKVIEPQYQTQVIIDDDGKPYSGVITYEDEKVVKLMANPLDENCKVEQIRKDSIDERDASKVSIMPEGLLDTMTKEEILDLLAYIISAGDPEHPSYR